MWRLDIIFSSAVEPIPVKVLFLNALSSYIPPNERIVTIEDSAELQITHISNLVRLETRGANGEGEGEVTIGDLIKAALRMNPSRIIVGEVRGREALDMISAMNTGHDGSLSTGHGNSPKDMLSRLETMVLMGADIPLLAVRSQVAAAIDILIHLGRLRDKSRRVLSIVEVAGYEEGEIILNPIYRFEEGETDGEDAKKVGEALRRLVILKTQKSSKQQALNYDIYILSIREWLYYSGQGVLIAALFSYIFYRSLTVFLIFIPFGIIVPLTKRKELKDRQLQQLNLEFKEGILLLSSFLSAGYSVENSVISASGELSVLYGEEGLITKEFRFIESQIHMNRSVEQALLDFALRSGLDDVKNFAEVFSTAKRSGGELVSIISHTADVIRDKVQVREEILTMTASKQFELKIMNLIPFFIVIYIDFTSPGFFQIMYTTGAGRILMTICMILYMIAYQTAKRIMEIEI